MKVKTSRLIKKKKIMLLNRKSFYDSFRVDFGSISQKQVEGFEAFFDEWQKQGLTDLRWLAYILATAWHETAHTMQPIEEYGKGKGRAYCEPGKNGKIFYGRGHTQNTWEVNYIKLTQASPLWDFHNIPELLLQMKPSIWATFYAMKTGLYTGKKLKDYFNGINDNPIGARKIINGTDKAEIIAGYYHKFLEALT